LLILAIRVALVRRPGYGEETLKSDETWKNLEFNIHHFQVTSASTITPNCHQTKLYYYQES